MRSGGSVGKGRVSTGAEAGTVAGVMTADEARGAVGTASVSLCLRVRSFGEEAGVASEGMATLAVSGTLSAGVGAMGAGGATAGGAAATRRFALKGLRIRMDFAGPAARAAGARLDFRATFGLALWRFVFLRAGRLAAGGDGDERLTLFLGLAARGFFNFMPAKYPS